MATSNRREVELALQITTANAQSILALQKDVAKLAKEGSDAAPEFQKLADELDRLSKEATALDGLDKVAQDVERMSRAQGEAAVKARELTAQYQALETATTEAAAKQREIEQALKQANREKQAAQDAIKLLTIEQKNGTREGGNYRQELRDQQVALLELRAKIRDYKAGLEEARAATSTARQAQNDLSNEYRNASTAATAANRRMEETRDRADEMARALGNTSLASADLAGAQNRLLQSFAAIKQEAQELTDAQERTALSAKALADANEQAAQRAQTDAAAYAQWWKNALGDQEAANTRAVAAMRQQTQAAKDASEGIRNAFGTVGATSVEALEAKIEATRKAMVLLKNSGALLGPELKVATKQGEDAIAALERQIRAAKGELTLMDRATNLWNQSMGGMKVGTLVAAGAISSLFQRVAELGPAMVKAIANNERLVQSLTNVFKSSSVAADQIAFLRKSANDAGVAVADIQQGFVKFSAAMTGANIPLGQSNALFSALTKASGSLGLSTDAVNRALEALGQIASKGTVSMEELRQQLGDALPGALGLAAKGLGLTEGEVIKLVSSGQLAAKDFFPAFTDGLGTVSGEANSLSQNLERLKNNVGAFFIAVGDAGALEVLKGALAAVTETLKVFGLGIATIVETILGSTRAVAAFSATLVGGGSLSEALAASGAEVKASADRLVKLNNELNGNRDATQAATVSATANATALGGMDAAAAGASKALLGLNLAVADEVAKLDEAAKVAEINIKTAETLGAAQSNAAKGIADLNIALQAEISAKTSVIATTEQLLTTRQQELALMQAQFEATKLLLEADGLLDDSDQKRLVQMAQAIEKQDAVVKGVRAKIAASKEDLAQSELEREMLKDNSGRLDQLRLAYDNAKAALAALQAQRQAGEPISEAEKVATTNLANASKLLGDSYADTEAKLKAKGITQQADIALQQAALDLQKAGYDSLAALGKAIGDVNLQRQAEIGKLEVQIKQAELHAKAMVLEADGAIAVAKAMQAKQEAMGNIDPVQKAQLDATIKSAEAQKLQAAAVLEGNKALQKQLDALRSGSTGLAGHANASGNAAAAQDSFGRSTSAATAALEEQNAALARNISAQEQANDLKDRAIALENKRRNVDKEGFSLNTAGDRIQEGIQTRRSVYENAKSQGLSEKEALRISQQFISDDGSKVGWGGADTARGENWGTELQKAIDKQVLANASRAAAETPNNQERDNAKTAARTTSAAMEQSADPRQQLENQAMAAQMSGNYAEAVRLKEQAAQATRSQTSSTAKTYNVTFNGTTVRTASDADAQNLIRLLQSAKLSA